MFKKLVLQFTLLSFVSMVTVPVRAEIKLTPVDVASILFAGLTITTGAFTYFEKGHKKMILPFGLLAMTSITTGIYAASDAENGSTGPKSAYRYAHLLTTAIGIGGLYFLMHMVEQDPIALVTVTRIQK